MNTNNFMADLYSGTCKEYNLFVKQADRFIEEMEDRNEEENKHDSGCKLCGAEDCDH